jgi:hypothetical protein
MGATPSPGRRFRRAAPEGANMTKTVLIVEDGGLDLKPLDDRAEALRARAARGRGRAGWPAKPARARRVSDEARRRA